MSSGLVTKGDRVSLNAAGQKLYVSPKKRERVGTIVGASRDGRCVYIVWDGARSRQCYSTTFVEKAGAR